MSNQQQTLLGSHPLTNAERDTIEDLIDRRGIVNVIEGLAEVLSAKADHIAENWQDSPTAELYNRACAHLLNVARHNAIVLVSHRL